MVEDGRLRMAGTEPSRCVLALKRDGWMGMVGRKGVVPGAACVEIWL